MLELRVDIRDSEYDGILYRGEVYEYLDSGLTRRVYVNSDRTKVIKILIDDDGINHNEIERDIYNSKKGCGELCHTYYDKELNIIVQDYLRPIDRELLPGEIRLSMSCRGEVGLDVNDRLLCYDLDEYRKY